MPTNLPTYIYSVGYYARDKCFKNLVVLVINMVVYFQGSN